MDRPDFRRLARLARDDDQASVVGVDLVEHDAAILQRVLSLFLWRRFRLVDPGGIGGLRGAFCFFLLHAHLLRRNADVEAVQLHVIDVFPPEAHQAGVDMKGLDRDERRQVGGRAAPPDAEIFAIGAKAGKHADAQVAKLHVAVELVGKCGDDALPENIRRHRHDRGEHRAEEPRGRRPGRPTPRTRAFWPGAGAVSLRLRRRSIGSFSQRRVGARIVPATAA